jgi:hypothetical protein
VRDGQSPYRAGTGSVEKVEEDEAGETLILGQTGNMYAYPVKGSSMLRLQPARSVFFPNLAREKIEGKTYLTSELSSEISSVIVDCRKIPVVYGPDAEANHRRVSEWTHSLVQGGL